MDFRKANLSKLIPALVACVVFFIAAAAYFAPQFRGDVLPQHDVIQYEGMTRDINVSREQTGEDPQWTGGMFGGMPAYLINVAYPAQIIKNHVGKIVRWIDTPAAFLFFAMLAMWLMLLSMSLARRCHVEGVGVGALRKLVHGLDLRPRRELVDGARDGLVFRVESRDRQRPRCYC